MSFKLSDHVDYREQKKIDACVRSSMATLEQEDVSADTPNSRFQRFLQIYQTLKPMFAFLSRFILIPQLWRQGVNVVISFLDTFVADGPNLTLQFKAGKDLNTTPSP